MYALLAREYGYTLDYLKSLTTLQIHLLLYELIEARQRENGDPEPAEADADGAVYTQERVTMTRDMATAMRNMN